MTLGDGAARAHYLRYSQWLNQQPAERLAQKRAEADALFHRVGITFAVYGQDEGADIAVKAFELSQSDMENALRRSRQRAFRPIKSGQQDGY